MTFIALDFGTSFIKGAVLDLDAQRIEHIHRLPFPDPIPGSQPLFREFDPYQILDAVRDLLNTLTPYADSCEGVVICSQMHCMVFTTPQGEPRSTMTTWLDQRVLMPHPSGKGTYFDVMMGRLSADEIRQLGGTELRVGLPVGVLFWLAEQDQLPDVDVIPASLPDFILSNLCGVPPVTELTNAQAHGALNLETLDWHHGVLAKLGLERLHLPQIVRHGDVVGTLKIGSRTVPCYTPVGDYQCALTGALLREGELSLNISTGSQVSLLRPQLEFGNFQTRAFFDGRFMITVTTIPAGRALNTLVRLLSELAEAQGVKLDDPWSTIVQAASAVEKTDLRVHLAFYNTPVGDHGEIRNIREEQFTIGHLFRAAFENMAENYHTCALRISPEQSWQKLVFSGGLAQKIELLRALIGERFGVPQRMCPTSEDTLLGLMALGMAFTGRTQTVEQAMTRLYETYDERVSP